MASTSSPLRRVHRGWEKTSPFQSNSTRSNVSFDTPDPACGELDYLVGDSRQIDAEYVMSNNFAVGGINTSIIFRRIDE